MMKKKYGKDVNEVQNVEYQGGFGKEFDGNDNNKNKDTDTHGIYDHDVNTDCKEDEYLECCNDEEQILINMKMMSITIMKEMKL